MWPAIFSAETSSLNAAAMTELGCTLQRLVSPDDEESSKRFKYISRVDGFVGCWMDCFLFLCVMFAETNG